jgi:hypothetical protein
MTCRRRLAAVLAIASLLASIIRLPSVAGESLPLSPADRAFFEGKIRPLLVQRCYGCHSTQAKTLRGGLRLDHRQGLLAGGESGPAVVPGDVDNSLLMQAIRREDDVSAMPPASKLPVREIELLTEWIRRGAPYPDSVSVAGAMDWRQARQFWSFQPALRHPLPTVINPAWPQQRIDYFIAAELDAAGFTPSRPADRRMLLRRLSFDVIGLPPSPDEVAGFLADERPDAVERLVERLLASPRLGERWARMWLDLARYADISESWLDRPVAMKKTGRFYRKRKLLFHQGGRQPGIPGCVV